MNRRMAASQHPQWKDGRTISSHGYVRLKMLGHHLADCAGYVYEHRLVAEQMLGRPLLPTEQVHHRNGDTKDNRPENLEVTNDLLQHKVRHRKRSDLRVPGEMNPEIICGCGCGATLPRYDADGRPRRFLPGHNWRGRKRANESQHRHRDAKGRFSKCGTG